MEDISSAIVKIQGLIDNLPLRAYRVSEYLRDIAEALGVSLSKPDEPPSMDRGIIIYKIWEGLKSINDSLEAEYSEDTDETIDRRSTIYPRLLEFSARLKVYQEAIISNEIYKQMEQRFKRIDSVLPPFHFDFTVSIHDLDSAYITNEVFIDIKQAVKRFENEEYPEAISYCGDASKRLTNIFAEYLSELSGKNCSSSEWGPKLREIENILETTQNPQNLGPKSRLEWFVLSNLYIVLWLRNAYAHRTETDNRIPQWQNARRKTMVEDCDCTRSSIFSTIQAAKYLQELLKNK
jgi:hypothetical protein